MVWLDTMAPSASSLMELNVSPFSTVIVMLLAYWSMEEMSPSAFSRRVDRLSAVMLRFRREPATFSRST